MKIEYIKGDVTLAPEFLIMHGCNAQGVQRSGVARVIREQFPEAYTEYRAHYEAHGLVLGEVVWANSNGKVIGNCITQESYGRDGKQYVDYNAVRSCIKEANIAAKKFKETRIAMPKIGAGLGGGEWDLIVEIIEEEATDFTPVVYEIE